MSYFINLRLNASNDPVTAGMEINALTAVEPVLILQSTDDDPTNPILLLQDLGGNTQVSVAVDGGAVFNQEGNDADFRVESVNRTHMLFVDGGFDSVLINTAVDFSSAMGIQTIAAVDRGLVIRGFAAQTANLQEWQSNIGAILSVVDENGFHGIATATPVSLVDCRGTTWNIQFFSAVTVSSWGVYNAAGAASTQVIGINGSPAYNGTINSTGGLWVRGLYFNPSIRATATLTALSTSSHLIGTWVLPSFDHASTFPTMIGVRSTIQVNNAGAVVTDTYGVRIESPNILAGAITNSYGLYIRPHTNAAVLNYAIYAQSGTVWFNTTGDANSDFIVASDTEPNLLRVDAGLDAVHLGDWDTNYLSVDKAGDTHWVGGGGLPFGSCYGNEIAWIQAAAVQNTWYDISDADMADGQLHNITHDGNGQLTVTIAGMYAADWAGSFEADVANLHIEITFSVNGAETAEGTNDFETVAVNRESAPSGNAILDLAANDTVNVSIRTTDAGAPDLTVDHLMIRLIQIGGT